MGLKTEDIKGVIRCNNPILEQQEWADSLPRDLLLIWFAKYIYTIKDSKCELCREVYKKYEKWAKKYTDKLIKSDKK